jgi:capsular polysaccharide biosynthesis protein
MEQEIDLRPYIAALLRRWRLIIGVAVLAALLVSGILMMQPRAYTYTAQILFTPQQSQLQFDNRFVTGNDPLNAVPNRSQVLSDLASNYTLEARVLPNLPPDLIADDFTTGNLISKISVSSNGDLIRISTTSDDPQEAEILLNIWVEEYVALVNELYGFDAEQAGAIQEQLALARERYQDSQSALEAFIGTGDLVQTEQRMAEIRALLDGARSANQAIYNQYLERARQLTAIINDAQTLLQQVQNGDDNAVATNLGQLLLRARAAGNFELPVNLRFDLTETGSAGVGAAEISELIQVLEQRHDELIAESQQFAAALSGRTDADFALPVDVRTRYEQELASLQEQYEHLAAQQSALSQDRNIALESVGILQRKLNERAVAAGTTRSEVQVIGVTQEPPQSMLLRLVFNAGVAGVLAAALTILVVLALEFLAQRRQLAAEEESSSERHRDRTAAGQP